MKPFLTAYWKNLLMLNYAVDPAVLIPYLPRGTELDSWNNTYYVSLVGFMFLNTRVKGFAIPYHRNFEEFNLRFYVRFKDGSGWKRGVVFIKEIVPKRIISFVANTLYGENYACFPMRNELKETEHHLKLTYQWKINKEWNFISAVTEKQPNLLIENREEQFITEHYWGYAKLNTHATSEYEVRHPQWKIYKVLSHELYCNIEYLYGGAFKEYLEQKPLSVFMAEGSDVVIMPKKVWRY